MVVVVAARSLALRYTADSFVFFLFFLFFFEYSRVLVFRWCMMVTRQGRKWTLEISPPYSLSFFLSFSEQCRSFFCTEKRSSVFLFSSHFPSDATHGTEKWRVTTFLLFFCQSNSNSSSTHSIAIVIVAGAVVVTLEQEKGFLKKSACEIMRRK